MVVNKNSWHYRFLVWLDSDKLCTRQFTVCSYVRLLISYLLVSSLVVIGALAILFSALHPLFMSVSLTDSMIAIVINILIGLGLYKIESDSPSEAKWNIVLRENELSDKIETNLFWLWVKSKHDKFCTIIKFKESN